MLFIDIFTELLRIFFLLVSYNPATSLYFRDTLLWIKKLKWKNIDTWKISDRHLLVSKDIVAASKLTINYRCTGSTEPDMWYAYTLTFSLSIKLPYLLLRSP